MTALGSLRRRVRFLYARLKNWRKVGLELGVNPGVAWRLAHDRRYEPKDVHLRRRLGLPGMAPAPVCERCGEVHVSRRCTRGRVEAVRWRDLPVGVLREAILRREEFGE